MSEIAGAKKLCQLCKDVHAPWQAHLFKPSRAVKIRQRITIRGAGVTMKQVRQALKAGRKFGPAVAGAIIGAVTSGIATSMTGSAAFADRPPYVVGEKGSEIFAPKHPAAKKKRKKTRAKKIDRP